MIEQPANFPLIELSFGIFFVLPLIIILTQYIKMSASITNSEKPLNGISGSINGNRLRRRAQSNKSIIRLLLAVVVGFFCCWAPFHAQRLVILYASDWKYIHEFNVWMFFVTGIFYYFSSTLNPILYNVMSRKMRVAFIDTFRAICFKTKVSRNSDLSSSTMYGRRSRSFREETQNIRCSVKKEFNLDDSRTSKRYNLLQHSYKGESIV
ncbi:hypothetical protein HHI36_011344 [Cryptolaemus montrouzieri]|uniref:G-protein coupled receptors family 1 profile domain-containing protein n=1 Tax=Cryptolaemus montrouzieri TaxID=559131 RepID=A0ABD2MLI0_9CUCU